MLSMLSIFIYNINCNQIVLQSYINSFLFYIFCDIISFYYISIFAYIYIYYYINMCFNQLIIICCSRWPFKNEENEHKGEPIGVSINSNIINSSNHTDSSERKEHLMAWLSISAQNIVILILLLALTVKFIFFEDKNNVIVNKQQYNEEKKLITKKKKKEEYDDPTNRNNTNTIDADMPVIEIVFPLSDEWEENPVEHANKEVQTNAIWLGTSNSNDESELSKKFETPRSLEDCIEIYKSKVRLLYRTIFNFVLSVIHRVVCMCM